MVGRGNVAGVSVSSATMSHAQKKQNFILCYFQEQYDYSLSFEGKVEGDKARKVSAGSWGGGHRSAVVVNSR